MSADVTPYTVSQPQPQPHAAPQPVYLAPVRRTNGLAIAAFVLGLLGFAVLPVIFGHIALRQIRRNGDAGSAFAIVGLVLGYLAIALYLVAGIALTSGILWAVNA